MKGQWGKIIAYMIGTAIATTILTVLVPMIGGGSWLPDRISRESTRIDELFWALIILSIVVFTIVGALVIYSLVHFRAAPGDMSDGEHIHGSARMEVAWIVIPSIIVFIVGFVSYDVLRDNEIGLYKKAAAKDAGAATMAIDVRGFSFGWAFRYKDLDGKLIAGSEDLQTNNELILPVSTVVRFNVMSCSGKEHLGRIFEQVRREKASEGKKEHRFVDIDPGLCEREWDLTTADDQKAARVSAEEVFAAVEKQKRSEKLTADEKTLLESQPMFRGDTSFADVTHAFWVPEARLKIDAVAGVRTYVQWEGTRVTGPEDRFQVVCAELCGAGHNGMRTDMCIVDKATFDWWAKLDVDGRRNATCTNLRLLSCYDKVSGSRDDLVADLATLTKAKPEASCVDAQEIAA